MGSDYFCSRFCSAVMHWQYMTKGAFLTCGIQRSGDKHGEVSDLKRPETPICPQFQSLGKIVSDTFCNKKFGFKIQFRHVEYVTHLRMNNLEGLFF